ncbi:MAG TPA: DNA polymerase [Candidatus Paceibacterota bacterium]|nr:DNA polymerase [Candidatus Paceibacterota bacterium]
MGHAARTKDAKGHERARLVLFDAHAIIHRAYHALPDFATASGEPTGGLYGLATMLMKAIAEFSPEYMAACYDLPGPTFRHKEYKDYKAGRVKADEDLKKQLARSRDVFTAFGIPIYDHPGFEADDMLGTIVEQTKARDDIEVVIVSGDMDTLQLVAGDKVRVFTLRKGLNDTVIYDEAAVRERFGFGPELLPDYKGLRGDPSDNIIGIAGIGEKTGSELIAKFGSIESIYVAIKKDEQALLDAGIKKRIVELLKAGEDEAKFSKMLATIRRDAPIRYAVPEETWLTAFQIDPALALFTTLEFRTLGARLKALLASQGGDAGAPDEEKPKDDAPEEAIDPTLLEETALALWLVDSDATNPSQEDILEHAGVRTFAEAREAIMGELAKAGLEKLYREIELPLIPIVHAAEARGIAIDVPYLAKLSKDYHAKLSLVEKKIHTHAGGEFNINSPKQLGEIIFDRLGLTAKGLKKTDGGARSTRESELEKLRDAHPIVAEILEYRELQKLLSTYIDNIPGMVGADGRLHAKFHLAGTTTGRMSSSDPNLQNIPVREGLGEAIRDAFVAGKGKTLVAFDYSQIEMRVLAMLSEDPGLTEVFQSGADAHTAVASRVFGVAPDAVTKEMRRRAKVINFGIIYGMGVNALKTNLGSTREEAQEFMDQYFVTFPKIGAYFDAVKAAAAKKGYTETFFGRRRHFRDMRSKLPYLRAAAERMAMNAPLQGTAADLVKIAMRRTDAALAEEGLTGKVGLLLQVHDELIFEVDDAKGTIDHAVTVIGQAMEHVTDGTAIAHIPLVVDAAEGKRWGSMTELPRK